MFDEFVYFPFVAPISDVLKCLLASINAENFQEPTLKAVERSFNQGQAN